MKVNKMNEKKNYYLEIIIINSEKSFVPLIGRYWLDILSPNWRMNLVNKINGVEGNKGEKEIAENIVYIKKTFNNILNRGTNRKL